MHKTEPHYYQNSYTQVLEATIVSLGERQGVPFAILDKTICYPEGGGQPGDRGTLSGIPIIDTISDNDGQILHLLESNTSLSVGRTVSIELDWRHRYDYMQQHTAQHLLSGILHTHLSIGTVAVHLGHDDLSIELDRETLSDEDIQIVEAAANDAIRKAVTITTFEVTQQGVEELDLRRPVKVAGDVRIVQIGQFDEIACGGVHVADTSELMYISYLRSERIRGHLKTYWLAGQRAINSIRMNRQIVDTAGTLLSLPISQIPEGITMMQEQLTHARYQVRQLSLRLATEKINQAISNEKQSGSIGIPMITLDATPWEEDEYKALPEAFLSIPALLLGVVRIREDGKLGWMVVVKGLEDQAIFTAVRTEALPIIDGKGGGKPPLWQGVGMNTDQRETFLERLSEIFRRYRNGKES